MTTNKKLVPACKLICAILLIIVLLMQFIPYWYGQYYRAKSELISKEKYEAMVAEMTEEDWAAAKEDENIVRPHKYSWAGYIGTYRSNLVNRQIFTPVLVLLFAFLAVFTYFKNRYYSVMCTVWSILAPGVGLGGMLAVPELFSQNTIGPVYPIFLAVYGVVLAFALFTAVVRILDMIQNIKRERAERKAKSSFAD